MSGNARQLVDKEVELYIALRREMLADAPWAFTASAESDRGCNAELLRESLAKKENAILVIEDGSRLVAAAGIVREERPKRRHLALLWGVYVTPAARGKGCARDVVSAAIAVARGWEGVAIVQLCVSSNAPSARRLYESLGFVAWGTEPDGMRLGGESFDETHMQLRL